MMHPTVKHLEILSRHLELKDSTILDVGAGIEVGVAATKTFVGQLLAFYSRIHVKTQK